MNINSKDCLLIQFIYVFSFAFFQTQISRDTGVHEATIRGWLKSEDKLRDYALMCEEGDGLARKKLRRVNNPLLDKAVFTWFSQATQDGAPVSGPLLQAQAEKMHEAMHGPEAPPFLASNGWLAKFRRRHGIRQTKLVGEVRSADHEAAARFPPQLRAYLDEHDIPDEAVYYTDETALYYRLLPNKSLAVANSNTKTQGFKQSKDHVMLLLTTNKTGTHKLKPLIIGRFENPRCLHHVNRDTLPVK